MFDQTSTSNHGRNLSRCTVRYTVLTIAAIGILSSPVKAAPVTLQFQAEIVGVSVGNPFDLPLAYQIGDIISGSFTFDPDLGMVLGDNAIAASQPFSLEFDINGTVVGTSAFRMEVFDNTAFSGSAFPGRVDVINLGCSEPFCTPELISLPEGEPFRVRSSLQFVGSSSVLSESEIITDPTTWNAFGLQRRLIVGFDNVGPGSVGFDAIVGSISEVPEPTAFCLTLSVGVVLYFASRRKRNVFHEMETPLASLRRLFHHALFYRQAIAMILVLLASSMIATYAEAAPIILQFKATVADGASVPFAVLPGESIDVEISFESGGAGPVYPQATGMRFEIAGKILQNQGFEIRVEDDRQRSIDIAGRIADPDNTPDTDFNELGDNIIISCQVGGPLFCGSIAGDSDFVFRPLLVFSGPPSLLDSTKLTIDESAWNSFPLREMSLLFQNVNTGNAVEYVGAYIGEIHQVPEPSMPQIILGMICLLLSGCRLGDSAIRARNVFVIQRPLARVQYNQTSFDFLVVDW